MFINNKFVSRVRRTNQETNQSLNNFYSGLSNPDHYKFYHIQYQQQKDRWNQETFCSWCQNELIDTEATLSGSAFHNLAAATTSKARLPIVDSAKDRKTHRFDVRFSPNITGAKN